jgi:F-type H+-transporting ATPase subunit delta
MKIPKEARRLARQLFQDSLTNGRPDEARIRPALEAFRKDRPRHSVGILKEYSRLLRLLIQSRHAVIESAAPLDEASATRISNEVKTRYGGDLTTEFKTNEALIGGLRVRVGSDVWDGSVRERLTRLANQL